MRTTVWSEEIADHTAKLLFETGSYLIDFNRPRKDWFVWKCGIQAPCYCNCRFLNSFPDAYEASTAYFEATLHLKFQNTQLIVGLASAGVSRAARVASRFRPTMSFVRTIPKTHGVGNLVEGYPNRNLRAIIIDDLCGSGGTILTAINNLKEEYGIETIGIVTITNWRFQHMWDKFDSLDIEVCSPTSYPNILRVGTELGEIPEEQANTLLSFCKAPLTHSWPCVGGNKE